MRRAERRVRSQNWAWKGEHRLDATKPNELTYIKPAFTISLKRFRVPAPLVDLE